MEYRIFTPYMVFQALNGSDDYQYEARFRSRRDALRNAKYKAKEYKYCSYIVLDIRTGKVLYSHKGKIMSQ